MPVMKLERIVTYFHQKPWLPTRGKSIPAYKRGKKTILAVKPQKNCKIKLACVENSGRKKQHCACKNIAPTVPLYYQQS